MYEYVHKYKSISINKESIYIYYVNNISDVHIIHDIFHVVVSFVYVAYMSWRGEQESAPSQYAADVTITLTDSSKYLAWSVRLTVSFESRAHRLV